MKYVQGEQRESVESLRATACFSKHQRTSRAAGKRGIVYWVLGPCRSAFGAHLISVLLSDSTGEATEFSDN